MSAKHAAVLALLTFTLEACCSQKLVSVPLSDGGVGTLLIDDEPDAGPADAGEKDAGPRDAGVVKDGGHGTTGGSTGTIVGGGNSGSGGGTTGTIVGGGNTGGSGGYVDAGPTCTQDPDLSGDWSMSADYD
ncbi:MAG TPA: hypothetical protein VMB50_07980, partial [Myxococcales bacterium]|nr:hypothetical protein [Myxococcales bacterium]